MRYVKGEIYVIKGFLFYQYIGNGNFLHLSRSNRVNYTVNIKNLYSYIKPEYHGALKKATTDNIVYLINEHLTSIENYERLNQKRIEQII